MKFVGCKGDEVKLVVLSWFVGSGKVDLGGGMQRAEEFGRSESRRKRIDQVEYEVSEESKTARERLEQKEQQLLMQRGTIACHQRCGLARTSEQPATVHHALCKKLDGNACGGEVGCGWKAGKTAGAGFEDEQVQEPEVSQLEIFYTEVMNK
ncbi:hypothetical protein R1flu_001384 [Riccia fluitans]|uniref:Uncharacterized protein n=1 Tax=Riccia fluitans TaxID=41844 RepID=A0ABD1Y341_9MARC